ncbi:MAG: RNA-binding protein [Acidobacteriota bacterium]|jgi:RNA recognition motif-containing protein|uniref:RNA recognition motif domain-containing protein n=1 Tax=Fundidesulfovibrio putealis TaxID=270496 RepID=UPI000412EB49|nr:RNA-binding protein [Fundidesulfovibrio putealis]
MVTNIYVGNLPFSASEDQVRQMFEAYGQVNSVKLINDRETGRPRGFGFVEMDGGAAEAIQALNGADCGGRTMKVNEARPRERRERW